MRYTTIPAFYRNLRRLSAIDADLSYEIDPDRFIASVFVGSSWVADR
jgi:hypothetical protein